MSVDRNNATLDIPALTAACGVDFAAARDQLLALYEEIEIKNARLTPALDLPCHRGCDACCHESVFITPLEFFVVWDWAQTHLSTAKRTEIVAAGIDLYHRNRKVIDALNQPSAGADHFQLARTLRFRCPLLGSDGACRVYPVRELYARLFGCSFNDAGGVYGCHLVGAHLAGKTVSMLKVRPYALRLDALPLTHKRQVYPYYLHTFFGDDKEAPAPTTAPSKSQKANA